MTADRPGHLHVECQGTNPEFGCKPKPHVHYDKSGFCANGVLHRLCRGTYFLSGKALNCPCDCHAGRRRKLRTLRRTYEPIPILDRLRGA